MRYLFNSPNINQNSRGNTQKDKGLLPGLSPGSSSATISSVIHPSCCSNDFSRLENTKIKMNCSVCTQDLEDPTVSKSRKLYNNYRAIGMGYVWGLRGGFQTLT